MDAWIKILAVVVMFSAISMIMPFLLIDPFVGLILLGVLLTLLVLTLEPATGKAMAQVTVPLILILFVFQVWLTGFAFQDWMLIIIFAVMYLMFTMFTGGSSFVEGGFIDAKVSLKLFPLYGVAIFLSVMIDSTRQLTVYIMAGTVFSLMILYFAFLRDYDKWPTYTQFKYADLVATTDINPKGKVKTGAEIWWAKTTGPPIKAGEKVFVVGISGMTMLVRRPDDISVSDQQ
jgi:membrane-bound ClpP family serine protease